MGSSRRIIRSIEPFVNPVKAVSKLSGRDDKKKKERQRQLEAALSAEAEEKRLAELEDTVPTLQSEEAEEAVKKVRRRIQSGFGRRSTILSTGSGLSSGNVQLGARPIGKPRLGGF